MDRQPIRVDDPSKFPDAFLLLPENWQATVAQIERLTKWKLGDVYIFETPMGKYTWKIIGIEVLNATEISQAIEEGATHEETKVLGED